MLLRVALVIVIVSGCAVAQTSFTTPLTNIPAPTYPATRALGFKVRFTQNRQSGDTLSHPGLPGGWIGGYDGTDNVLYYSFPYGGETIANIVSYIRQVRFTFLTVTGSIERSFQWEALGFCSSFASTYQYYGSSVTTTTAANTCASVYVANGFSYLAGVSTSTENSAVRSYVNGVAGGVSFWINNNDEIAEGQFRMRTGPEGLEDGGQGRLAPYLPWAAGEPNNSGNEDCTQVLSGGTWNDLPCSAGLPYVCERSATSFLHSGTVSVNSGGYVSNLYERSSAATCGSAPTPTYITWCCPQVTAVCDAIQAICNSWDGMIAGQLAACEGENEYCAIHAAAVTLQQSCQRLYGDCHARNVQC